MFAFLNKLQTFLFLVFWPAGADLFSSSRGSQSIVLAKPDKKRKLYYKEPFKTFVTDLHHISFTKTYR